MGQYFLKIVLKAELGMRKHCRVTVFSGHKVVGYCIITLVEVTTPFKLKDFTNFSNVIWSLKFYYVVAFSRCRCREA